MRNTGAKMEVKEQRCNLQMISHTPNGENWRLEAVIKMYYEKVITSCGLKRDKKSPDSTVSEIVIFFSCYLF